MYEEDVAEMDDHKEELLGVVSLDKKSRYYYADFLHKMGYLLEVPQTTTATALVFFHKFFSTFTKYDKQLIACSCMFLACKVDENTRRLRDVINVMNKITKPDQEPSSLLDKYFLQSKDVVADHEQIILRALMFNVRVKHPYKYLVNYVACIQGTEGLLQLSYAIVNDSFRTTLCLRYKPNDIAAAAIYLAARMTDYKLPYDKSEQKEGNSTGEEDSGTRPWFHLFQTTQQTIDGIILELDSMYRDHRTPIDKS
ncbi:cyclin-T1-5 [Acrasis kona]|uniref:Cyclin-T1-5 n=1 Tax=Acrasis kona TaxID=1008807 RepID=A0AAW2YWZ4_9EUKA